MFGNVFGGVHYGGMDTYISQCTPPIALPITFTSHDGPLTEAPY